MPCIAEGRLQTGRRNRQCFAGEAEPAHSARLVGLCASPSTAKGRWTGVVARSIDWLRCSTPAGYRVAALDRLRRSRLTFEKDTRTGLSREEIGCYACQIRLDADAQAV